MLPVRLLALAVLAATSVSPQSSPRGLTETIDVALVNVHVRVTDRQGLPVADLDADDFRLLVDGSPVAPTHFARVGRHESPDPTAAPATTPERQNRLVVYIDTAFLGPGELATVEPILAGFLQSELPASISVMLAVANPELHPVTEFSTDREIVVKAIRELSSTVGQSRLETEYSQIQREFEDVLDRASSGAMPYVAGSQADSVLTQIGGLAASVQIEVQRAASRLSFLVHTLQGLPGSREILFVTGRPPAHAGQDLLAAWRQEMGQNQIFSQGTNPAEGGGQASEDSDTSGLPDGSAFGSVSTPIADLDAAGAFHQAATQAAVAGVTINTLDLSASHRRGSWVSTATAGQGVAGNPSGGFTRSSSLQSGIKDLRLLEEVAHLTGGELIQTSSLADRLSQLTANPGMGYSLAFALPGGLNDGPHRLAVELTQSDPDYRLSHRRFFRIQTEDQLAAHATISGVLSGQTHNPLNASLDLQIRQAADRKARQARVTLILPFSRVALQPDGNHHLGQISVFSLSGRPYRQASAVNKSTLPVRIANDQMLTALGRSIEYSWEMELPSESSSVAVGIRDDLSNLMSTLMISAVEDR